MASGGDVIDRDFLEGERLAWLADGWRLRGVKKVRALAITDDYRLAIRLEVVRGIFHLPKPLISHSIHYAPSAYYLILQHFDNLSVT